MNWKFWKKPAPEPEPVRVAAAGVEVPVSDYRRFRYTPFRDLVRSSRYIETTKRHVPVRATEAETYWPGDPDDVVDNHSAVFRPASTGKDIVAIPGTFRRLQDESVYLSEKSSLAIAMHTLTARYIVGDGITITAADERVQEVIDEWVADEHNHLTDPTAEDAMRQRIYGATVLLAKVSDAGRVRFVWWDPRDVAAVAFEGGNISIPDRLYLVGAQEPSTTRRNITPGQTPRQTQRAFGNTAEWRVIRYRDDEKGGTQLLDGDALYVRANATVSPFGAPDYQQAFHLLDQYDEILALQVYRAHVMCSYVFHETLEGAMPEDVEKRTAEKKSPVGGTWYVTNDHVRLEAIAPDLRSGDFSQMLQTLKRQILAAGGFPPSWVAEDNANRATALAQGEPTRKVLESKQGEYLKMVKLAAEYVVHTAAAHGYRGVSPSSDLSLIVEASPITADKSETQAGTLNATALAVANMINNGLVSREIGALAVLHALVSSQILSQDEILQVSGSATLDDVPLPELVQQSPEVVAKAATKHAGVIQQLVDEMTAGVR